MNWNSASDLINQPQKTADRQYRHKRLREGCYEIPFFSRNAFTADNPEIQQQRLIDRIEQAVLSGIPDLADLTTENENGELNVSHRFQRMSAILEMHCDYVNTVRDQIKAEFGFEMFNLADVRVLVLKHKKEVIFREMNRKWKVGWAANWQSFRSPISTPKNSRPRASTPTSPRERL